MMRIIAFVVGYLLVGIGIGAIVTHLEVVDRKRKGGPSWSSTDNVVIGAAVVLWPAALFVLFGAGLSKIARHLAGQR